MRAVANLVSCVRNPPFGAPLTLLSALGPEAKIQTGTQSQSYREACILKSCCDSCSFCSYRRHVFQGSVASRKRLFPAKACRCFFCKTVRFCDQCKRCSNCYNPSSCMGQAAGVLADLGLYGSQSTGGVHFKERLHPPFSDKASSRSGTFDSEPLRDFCQAEPFTGVDLVALSKTSRRTGTQPVLPRVLQPPLFGSKTKQQMAAHFGSQCSKLVSACKNFQDGNPRVHKVVSSARGMGHIARLQQCLLPHSHKPRFPKISTVPPGRSNSAISSLAIRPLHPSYGVHHCGQGGKAPGSGKGNPVTPIPRRLANPELDQRVLLLPDTGPSDPLSGTRLGRESAQVRIGPKTGLRLCGYRYDLNRVVLPTPQRWQILNDKIHFLLERRSCSVRQFMSLIGLLTATEKPLGRLHMRPIQWHLKWNWHIQESLEKNIPIPASLHPHLKWWLQKGNVLLGQPLHPLQHALQLFTNASREGWGAHLGDHTARGFWSLPESKLNINMLELKAVLLALKEFQDHCLGQVVLIATDNTTVVSYINKEGSMRSGSLCALLWRQSQEHHTSGAIYSGSPERDCRQAVSSQSGNPEWSLHQEVFNLLFQRWHTPEVDLFATRYNNKLPKFVSPVLDPQAWAVDALSFSWEDLDLYAFPPIPLLGNVVNKLLSHNCKRLTLIAPGWPNMPWFWDLVELSVQIPLCLPQHPNLVVQPFNGSLHRDLVGLNLHAWLLGSRRSNNRDSLTKWQQELSLLKDH